MNGAFRSQGPPKFADMMEFVNLQSDSVPDSIESVNSSISETNSKTPNNDGAIPIKATSQQHTDPAGTLHMLKAYFDLRLHEMERRILGEVSDQLNAMDERQNVKLDVILRSLEQKSSRPVSEKFQQIDLD